MPSERQNQPRSDADGATGAGGPGAAAGGVRPGGGEVLCVVCPCYNEQEVLPAFHRALKEALDSQTGLDYRVLYVDDGSTDRTLATLNALADADRRVLVYSLSRNFGHQVALTAGLDAADCDAVICMDCDLQHPPKWIGEMVRLWREGNDVVSTVRKTTSDASWLKRSTSAGFYWLINRLSETPIVPGAADFFLLSRRAQQALNRMPERHRFLRGMVSWIGFRRVQLPFDAPARAAGQSKYTLWKMVRLGMDAVFSFSAAPMKVVGRAGLAIVGMSVLYLLYVLGRMVIVGDLVAGWASLIAVVSVLGGLQLLAIGVSGEYLARLYEEAKSRPLYFLKQSPGRRP
jgi:dolichol-phosphate mannosyltransferase